VFAEITQPTLLGIAAVIAAIGGIVSTITADRRARKEERAKAEKECIERLKETRAESEKLAEELHRLKMERFDD